MQSTSTIRIEQKNDDLNSLTVTTSTDGQGDLVVEYNLNNVEHLKMLINLLKDQSNIAVDLRMKEEDSKSFTASNIGVLNETKISEEEEQLIKQEDFRIKTLLIPLLEKLAQSIQENPIPSSSDNNGASQEQISQPVTSSDDAGLLQNQLTQAAIVKEENPSVQIVKNNDNITVGEISQEIESSKKEQLTEIKTDNEKILQVDTDEVVKAFQSQTTQTEQMKTDNEKISVNAFQDQEAQFEERKEENSLLSNNEYEDLNNGVETVIKKSHTKTYTLDKSFQDQIEEEDKTAFEKQKEENERRYVILENNIQETKENTEEILKKMNQNLFDDKFLAGKQHQQVGFSFNNSDDDKKQIAELKAKIAEFKGMQKEITKDFKAFMVGHSIDFFRGSGNIFSLKTDNNSLFKDLNQKQLEQDYFKCAANLCYQHIQKQITPLESKLAGSLHTEIRKISTASFHTKSAQEETKKLALLTKEVVDVKDGEGVTKVVSALLKKEGLKAEGDVTKDSALIAIRSKIIKISETQERLNGVSAMIIAAYEYACTHPTDEQKEDAFVSALTKQTALLINKQSDSFIIDTHLKSQDRNKVEEIGRDLFTHLNRIEKNKGRDDLEPKDLMTEPQLLARIRDFFVAVVLLIPQALGANWAFSNTSSQNSAKNHTDILEKLIEKAKEHESKKVKVDKEPGNNVASFYFETLNSKQETSKAKEPRKDQIDIEIIDLQQPKNQEITKQNGQESDDKRSNSTDTKSFAQKFVDQKNRSQSLLIQQ